MNTIETIKSVLAASGCDAWEITDTRTNGWEFYFIRHDLDQNRARNVEHIRVKLYIKSEDGKSIGSSSVEIPPTASREDVEKAVSGLKYQAGLVWNPCYTLHKGDGTLKEDIKKVDVEKISRDFIETLAAVPETATEDINSYEIFVSEITCHYLNSEGVETLSVYPSSMAEVVVNARDDQLYHGKKHEVELYRMYRSGTCDRRALTEQVSRTLEYARDKLVVQPTPALQKGAVVFSTSVACSFFRYFLFQTSARAKYMHLSSAEAGKPFCEGVKGDKVTLKALRFLPNSSRNFSFDEEGAPIENKVLIENGIVRNLHGDRQYASYLGLPDSHIVYIAAVDGGSKTAQELRSGTYLEVTDFSDFEVNPMSGDIAGEIRLGYYHEGDKVTIVSGGSVSGNFREAMKEMYLSKEQTQYDTYLVPSVLRVENLTITGISR